MPNASLLPEYLVNRYQGWRATSFEQNKAWHHKLATQGQNPRCMVISCCDSRINVLSMFGADQGELFIHRNVANLVPPIEEGGRHHGTSSAVEYAVTALKVSNLLIVGHSDCGGVRGCYNMCSGNAPELESETSFVGRWMDILRPTFETLPDGDDETRVRQLEKNAVVASMDNLMTFPFVKDAVEAGQLSLHGLWTDMGLGLLEQYDSTTQTFIPV